MGDRNAELVITLELENIGEKEKMQIQITWSDKFTEPARSFTQFVQLMANRIIVGHVRYGSINRGKFYLDCLDKELKAYKKTGNAENLLNIANYAYLENEAPQNELHHFNNNTSSVTRKRNTIIPE